MGSILRKRWICGIIFITIIISGCGSTPTSGSQSGGAKISKEEFDKIQNGMTYEEVVQIIGGEGELISEAGSEGEAGHTVVYMWEGEGDIGANANFMFQDGKLINKAQAGLK